MKKTIFLAIAVLFAAANCFAQIPATENPDAPALSELELLVGQPEVGKMYKVEPQGAVNSDGSKWTGVFKKGKENKVLFIFCGGGVAFNSYTEARSLSASPKDMYYVDNLNMWEGMTVGDLEAGFCKQSKDNMFKDWTLICLPYTTGDFHCGNNERQYMGVDGKQHTMYYHGYQNYNLMMKQVMPFVGIPDALVITGFSAGGFATAILSDDVISYFPYTKNVTSCVDASILIKSDWPDIAKNVWKAPAKVCSNVKSTNLSLDCLEALHRDRPYVKILFGVSIYDDTLTYFQTYLDNGKRRNADREALDAFHTNLKAMCKEFQQEIPDGGLYLWDDIIVNKEFGSTEHTTTFSSLLWANHGGHGGFGKWMADAVNGNVKTYGLELLK